MILNFISATELALEEIKITEAHYPDSLKLLVVVNGIYFDLLLNVSQSFV
jgi:hypothetical protein